ncbi:winged helix DNA-binding domain-containing protein [Mucilaginibacter sp. FT3.2]|uniref:winged helix DNA-binding domain-containing protein n=1 Tax=Mucilaginibacter sp. FT3.2 TaxID=2723090 RepID=UPI00160A9628|nr:winged helix DNA-binding domain-containing protein [Mucilaginibacter sp. FT3.2]MBB6234319.1 hypothetical protein [Mucilaginibacter sp. FT3.2]
MKDNYIASLRIFNQHISNPQFTRPQDIVKNMVAMQAQDYAGAKWAIGLRMQNANDTLIETAFTEGKILRTHLLRPTWHFVSPDDIRWILALTAPRINTMNAGTYKKFELDAATLSKSNDVFVKALGGNKQLTRAQLTAVLTQNSIPTDDLRFTLLLMHAELDGIICSGARVGKQFTYALLDDRVPATPALSYDEALSKLAAGYFNTRGPATVHDFANWSGLTVTDAGIGLEHVRRQLISETIEGKTYWMPQHTDVSPQPKKAYLLPAYDEFAIAYKDRAALVKPEYREPARHVIFDPVIVIDNQVVGNWKRAIKTNTVDIDLRLYGKLNKSQQTTVQVEANRYRNFVV